MNEEYEFLARVTAAELGYEVVRWWQDAQEPCLLRIEAQHIVGEDRIIIILATFLP